MIISMPGDIFIFYFYFLHWLLTILWYFCFSLTAS